jgi:hypothetical protein
MNCLTLQQQVSLIVTCHSGTFLGSCTDPIVNAMPNVGCIARIAKGSKSNLALTYHGRKTQYGGNKEIVTNFWFCPDNIERYVKGTKCP